ncbi:MAG: GNAT family N-acetyltransferase [Acidimicrobiia bacterium]|nr:GNAT family N-acetyltransferase [Acidimicrobiia bacterium]MCY4433573.1 GNAT family N-acetyltransferase [bacterium]
MSDRPKDGAARPAHPDDFDAIAGLAREARREALEYRGGERWMASEAAPEPLEGHLAELIADPEAVLVAGIWDDTVVGYGWARRIIRLDGSPIARIEELFVTPDGRSVGVGESLFDYLKQWARDQKVVAIDAFVLPGHREAKNFFETFKMTAHALIVHTQLDLDQE